jgi:hypothetical protein
MSSFETSFFQLNSLTSALSNVLVPFQLKEQQPLSPPTDPNETISQNFNPKVSQIFCDIEADVFYYVTSLLDTAPYIFLESEMKKGHFVTSLADIVTRCDPHLDRHLNSLGIEYVHFAYRWFICLLQREIPNSLAFRLWDSYIALAPVSPRIFSHFCFSFLQSLRYFPSFSLIYQQILFIFMSVFNFPQK